MIARRIANFTRLFGAPAGWDQETNGPCVHLAVRVVHGPAGAIYQSAWEPTPDELSILNAGGSIVLSVVGGQPPVALGVEPLE